MFTAFKRVIKSGWLHFSRDGGQIAATIFILILTVSAITSSFLFQKMSQFVLDEVREKVDISVYFAADATEDEILGIQEAVRDISEVKEVNYLSKDEALVIFTERHKDDPVLLESLEEVGMNPFLAALNIKAFKANQYGSIASFLESGDFNNLIEKVDYHQRKPAIDRILSVVSSLNVAGLVLSLILALVAVLVAFSTIRLAIYNSREEIKIQRLVGASNWFIRGPFVVQGAISGTFASLVSLFLVFLVSWLFGVKLEALFPGLNLFSFFVANFWAIFLLQLVCGLGLGVISSLIAVRRYLEV